LTVTYPDHQEVYEPGDAFYMPPGHTPAAESGTEFVMFSPADELAKTDAAITAAMTGTS
jgi:ribosomal protein L16 Arg81 hydroxylase